MKFRHALGSGKELDGVGSSIIGATQVLPLLTVVELSYRTQQSEISGVPEGKRCTGWLLLLLLLVVMTVGIMLGGNAVATSHASEACFVSTIEL